MPTTLSPPPSPDKKQTTKTRKTTDSTTVDSGSSIIESLLVLIMLGSGFVIAAVIFILTVLFLFFDVPPKDAIKYATNIMSGNQPAKTSLVTPSAQPVLSGTLNNISDAGKPSPKPATFESTIELFCTKINAEDVFTELSGIDVNKWMRIKVAGLYDPAYRDLHNAWVECGATTQPSFNDCKCYAVEYKKYKQEREKKEKERWEASPEGKRAKRLEQKKTNDLRTIYALRKRNIINRVPLMYSRGYWLERPIATYRKAQNKIMTFHPLKYSQVSPLKYSQASYERFIQLMTAGLKQYDNSPSESAHEASISAMKVLFCKTHYAPSLCEEDFNTFKASCGINTSHVKLAPTSSHSSYRDQVKACDSILLKTKIQNLKEKQNSGQ